MPSWKSRCSGLRLVNTATENQMASTRCRARACDDTSRATAPTPRSAAAARAACSSVASGVVRGPDRVPMTSASRPSASRTALSRWVVVVLPLVPVTPTTASRRDGCRWRAAAARAMAARLSATTTWGTVDAASTGRSHSRATAPAATAWGAKSWPSAIRPRTQQNSDPGRTSRDVAVMAVDVGAAAGSPRSSTTSTSPSTWSSRTSGVTRSGGRGPGQQAASTAGGRPDRPDGAAWR